MNAKSNAEYRNRAKGLLWGLVVGDCFGSPIQFSTKDGHPTIVDMVACPVFGLPPGYWTDDSSMAMCIMDSFVRKGGYDLKDVAETFRKWLDDGYLSSVEGRSFDVGGATASAIHAYAANGTLVNGNEATQGNGSVMRHGPAHLVALTTADHDKTACEISDLTHASSIVRKTVLRLSKAIADGLNGKRTRLVSQYASREEAKNSGWAVSTVESALWAFNATDTFADGLVAAVNLGGDSDTIGAVYGQIAGAYYGFNAIPQHWVEAVKDWEKVDAFIDRFLDAVLT